jgi:hypothetical protein
MPVRYSIICEFIDRRSPLSSDVIPIVLSRINLACLLR